MQKVPSLVDLCIQVAIDNLRYLGDVGETDSYLLDRILPHCTVDQLMHIENSTEGRDLSPVTDELWKKFYMRQFGTESVDIVAERMRQKRVVFKWKQLYEAKLKEREEATQKSLDRVKKRYQEENARKQSRQVQLCTKIPPSSRKRSFESGSSICNAKSGLMKKAKLEFLNSHEVKNLAAMKNKAVHRSNNSFSVPSVKKPSSYSGLAAASSLSKLAKPVQKRI
ncbi:uncharacterized protein [Henckelia pumila]|uniref:uncharacterized protein n=1 Tax=Henckelia pumila TaxID=405737 RepID=UPI003C6DFAAA